MTASGRENGADAENPRSRNLPLGNGGPQCENNIGITGAHVSHGSETGGQRDCRVVSRIESDLGIGIFDRAQSVSLVELRRQVHVAIDEPRKDEFLAKIDKLTARRRIDEAARHRLDPLAFDKNALLRFGLDVWIGEQNASVNNFRLRGPSRIVCHGLFRPKLTIFCVTAPTDQRSPPKCLTILDPGAKPDNMIVGRESRSGIAPVNGPGHAECLPGGRIAPLGLPENALDVAQRKTSPLARRRERKMQGFRSAGSAQRFLSSHSATYNTFNVCRHLTTAGTHRILRGQAFDAWKTAVAAPA